jgi:hypothetical protein
MKGAIAMRNHERHGRTGSSRGFTLIELLEIGESDTLPKGEEPAAAQENA